MSTFEQSALFPRGGSGYGDLLLALRAGGEESAQTMAELLGFGLKSTRSTRTQKSDKLESSTVLPSSPLVQSEMSYPRDVPLFSFWRLEGFSARDALQPLRALEPVIRHQDTRPASRPQFKPLIAWNRLLPKLRQRGTELVDGPDLDLDRIVRRIMQGLELNSLPRLPHRRWGRGVQIILDRSSRLIPMQQDLDEAAKNLMHLFGKQSVEWAYLWDGRRAPVLKERGRHYRSYRLPEPGTLVVVLGDLGCLAQNPVQETDYWERLGRRIRRAGCRAVGVTPCPVSRWLPERLRSWTLVAMGPDKRTSCPDPKLLAQRADRLLQMGSSAVRIEAGLLRDWRLLLGRDADAGTEVDVWNHPAMAGRSREAGVLDPGEAEKLRLAFCRDAARDSQLCHAVVRTMRHWRSGLAPEVWFEELMNLPEELLPDEIRSHDWLASRQFFKSLDSREMPGSRFALLDWFRRVVRRAEGHFFQADDPELKQVLQKLYLEAFPNDAERPLPAGFDLRLLPMLYEQPRSLRLGQQGDELVVEGGEQGSLLGVIRSRQDKVRIGEYLDEEPLSFWKSGTPPSWADAWGWDDYGAWVEFVIQGVRQRMRWMEPGSFMMGSPENEQGRDNDEGPQHQVIFRSGFWMGDTACTQALWQAVMGDNPSHFNSSDHPVEMVNFADVQKFFTKVETMLPGLDLGLPSEAQWEYACRAGTTTPFSFGETITMDQVNFASNVYLPDDSKGKGRSQTVPVASLPVNPWGLYEMHGNVWEWCQDVWHKFYDGAPTDGRAWVDDADGRRVVRGGSWNSPARSVRAAVRRGIDPSIRGDRLGFRCARVQKSQSSQPEAAEPVSARPVRLAERRTRRAETGSAVLIDLRQSPDKASCVLPDGQHFQIQSDCETLTFGQLVKPAWADAIGRDRYGLWAEFVVGAVRQRMRWISPGRFMMGSPEDEEGRYGDEGPQREVTFQSGFWLFDTVCTQALWLEVMKKNPSRFQSPDRPVEQVDFDDVQQFLQQLGQRHPGLNLTLPSEAQWEYACRAGTTTPFSFGPTINTEQVNFDGNNPYLPNDSKGKYRKQTVAVASLPANPWGLFEMHGNVWEWCADGWHESYHGAPTDGSAWVDDAVEGRVVRGGSWFTPARDVRAACRDGDDPSVRFDSLGFRCARVQ